MRQAPDRGSVTRSDAKNASALVRTPALFSRWLLRLTDPRFRRVFFDQTWASHERFGKPLPDFRGFVHDPPS